MNNSNDQSFSDGWSKATKTLDAKVEVGETGERPIGPRTGLTLLIIIFSKRLNASGDNY